MQNRHKPNEMKKLQIGIQCCNCGSTESLEYHHIVPLALGGNDIETNMCCLCYSCHYLIHHGKNSYHPSHSELIKQGIKNSNKKQGRKEGSVYKLTNELQEDIKLYLCNKDITQISLMNKHNISRNTLKKYIQRIENQEITKVKVASI